APEELAELTAEPRRYGFHGTLKPPFALAAGATEAALLDAAGKFALSQSAFNLPGLHLVSISGFLALVPTERSEALHALADTTVQHFDVLRAPASPEELARRRRARLSPRQEALLERWGYPYVMEEFRFHLTLTRRLSAEERARIEPPLLALTAPVTRRKPRIA